jgi:hypothetical protein
MHQRMLSQARSQADMQIVLVVTICILEDQSIVADL